MVINSATLQSLYKHAMKNRNYYLFGVTNTVSLPLSLRLSPCGFLYNVTFRWWHQAGHLSTTGTCLNIYLVHFIPVP